MQQRTRAECVSSLAMDLSPPSSEYSSRSPLMLRENWTAEPSSLRYTAAVTAEKCWIELHSLPPSLPPHQVKWCHLHSGQAVLVVTSFAGFMVFDSTNEDILLHYRLSSSSTTTGKLPLPILFSLPLLLLCNLILLSYCVSSQSLQEVLLPF